MRLHSSSKVRSNRTQIPSSLAQLTERRVYALTRALLCKAPRSSKGSADVLLICHDNNRGYTFRGKAYAQLLDTVGDEIESLGYRVATVAKPPSRLVGDIAHRTPIQPRLVLLTTIFYKFYLLAKSCVFFGLRAKSFLDGRDPVTWAWRRTISRLGPSAIIGILPKPQLCLAAAAEGVATFDLQHGVINRANYDAKAIEDKWGAGACPDVGLCWDDLSALQLDRCSGGRIRSEVVGHPWVQRFLDPRGNDSLVEDAQANADNHLHGARPLILVSLQYRGQDADHGDFQWLSPLVDWMRQKSDVVWAVRVHPVGFRRSGGRVTEEVDRRFAGTDNVLPAEIAFSLPLPILLKQAHAHLTKCSSTVFEAAWFGVHSWCYSPQVADPSMQVLAARGVVTISDDFHRLREWVEGIVEDRKVEGKSEVFRQRLSTSSYSTKRANWDQILGSGLST